LGVGVGVGVGVALAFGKLVCILCVFICKLWLLVNWFADCVCVCVVRVSLCDGDDDAFLLIFV